MQYRPQQATQGRFPPVSGPSQSQRPYGYPQTTVYPIGQPVYVTAPMTGMPQFQTQNFEPHVRERKIIQIKDANRNKDVTQEILNRQPSGSLTGSTGGTSNNSSLDTSEQSAGSRTFLAEDSESENSETGDSEREDSMSEDSEMEQYRHWQATQGQFPPVSGPSQPKGPYGYTQTTVYPIGQPSPPFYMIRAPTAPIPGMPQFQTQNFVPRALERKIIHIKDPNSNIYVTQEILNRQPSGSLTGSTTGTPNSSTPDLSGQSSSSSTPPLTSQQQAEANVRAQFAAQVAAILANYSESEGSTSEDSEMEQYRPQQATMKPIDTNRTGLY